MSKQSLKFWAYAMGAVAIAVILTAFLNREDAVRVQMPAGTETLTIATSSGTQAVYRIALAKTREQQATGLMYRDHIDDDYGMLFPYDPVQTVDMWMHNTRIPLDMLFIDAGGKIVHIHADAQPYDDTPIPSQYPVRAVLELKGGQVAARAIHEGDRVIYPLFKQE